MIIPERSECLILMERVAMPAHIRRHCFLVAEIALYLSHRLNQNSIRLNLELVEAGALLHDIAKPRSIRTGEHHDELGAQMVEGWGYGSVAPIVKEHVVMDLGRVNGPITESVVVNYADKRVKHDRIVTLEDRFHDLMDRYAKTLEQRARLRDKLDLYLELEHRIFDHLAVGPTEPELMNLSPDRIVERGSKRYEGKRQETHSGVIGGREVG